MSFVSKSVCEIVIKWMLNKLNSVLNNFPSKNNEWKNALSKKKKKMTVTKEFYTLQNGKIL